MRFRIPTAVADFLALGGGFLLWSFSFALIYALLSLGCAFGWERVPVAFGISLQRVVLTTAWLASVAAIVVMFLPLRRRGSAAAGAQRFVRATSLALTLAATAVTVVNFAAVTTLSTCL